jgi:hypothetical protein
MENKIETCILCRKELDRFEEDICESCLRVLRKKYPSKTKLREVIKCHKENAKQLDS